MKTIITLDKANQPYGFPQLDGGGSLHATGSLYGTSSFALSASWAPFPDIDTGSLVTTSSFNAFTSSYYQDSSSFDTRIDNLEQFSSSLDATFATDAELNQATASLSSSISSLSSSFISFTASYNTGSFTGSFIGSLTGTSSWANNSVSSSYALSASFTSTASFAPNYLPLAGGTISGSLTVTNNLTVLGSASIQYISESTLNIGTNLITVNTINPGARFGGLAVIDSGSSPMVSASFLYDSVQDEFIFVHRGTSTSAITSSHFLLGPETYNDLGNEIYLTANRIPKSVGNEHLNDSNISDNGTIVSINSNTQITGSVIATQGFTGSLFGTASNAISSSWAPPTFPFTGSAIISGSLTVTGSINGLIIELGSGNINTNVAIGSGSLSSNTTGDNNIAQGINASRNNTTGVSNIAIGPSASFANTTGSFNTAIGTSALLNNVTSFNTAIGPSALRDTTTGNLNVAVGVSSLRSNTTGIENTAVGTTSLPVNTVGNYNVVVGSNALRNNTTGNNNIAIGTFALFHDVTGSNNIAHGFEAGRRTATGANLTSVSASIFIGSSTRALANGQTNQIVIGHNAIGIGSNSTVLGNSSTTQSLIWGNTTISGSFTVITGSARELQVTSTGVDIGNLITDIHTVTGSLNTSGSLNVTGSVIATQGFTGSFSGSGANLSNIPASGIIGLNLSQISSGSVSASISPNNGLQINTNVTATSFTGSLFGTSSWAEGSISSSFASTASFLNTLNQDLTFNGTLTINGTASINTLVYNTINYSTGSNQLGSSSTDVQTLYGNVNIPTGSLTVTGSITADTINIKGNNIQNLMIAYAVALG